MHGDGTLCELTDLLAGNFASVLIFKREQVMVGVNLGIF
jgi:hypothetical protein